MGSAVGNPDGMAGKLLGSAVGIPGRAVGKPDGIAGRPEGIAGNPDGIPGIPAANPDGSAVGTPKAVPPSAAGIPAAGACPGAGPEPGRGVGDRGVTAGPPRGVATETAGAAAAVVVAVSAVLAPEPLAFCWLHPDATKGMTPSETSRPAAMLLIDAEGNA
jgi:hypothetical protein